ncbi:peptide ABC transporter permease [Spirochaetia bacterium]|nr:peptide ABC transporter permease [Spirochaetia bacterium]
MTKYILKRVVAALISMFVLITITFFLMHAIPGGPFSAGEEKNVPPRVLEALRAKYGLDLPVWKQYLNYMGRLLHGDLGDSFKKLNYTVNELILGGAPVSAVVGSWAILVALAAGIPLGIIAALKRGGWMDWFSMIIATIGISMPTFIIAILMMYFFSMKLGWLPVYGYGTVKHLVIPVICLSLSPIAYITRLTRSSMLEVARQDYMRTARAKGVSEFMVIAKHGMRNSILPVVTYLGPLIAALLTGSFVVERLFMLPGIGRFFVSAVSERDYSVILGLTIFYGGFIMVCTLLVDIAYALIDPRVKFTE